MVKKLLFLMTILFIIPLAAEERELIKLNFYGFIEAHGWHNNASMIGNDLILWGKEEDKSNTGMTLRKTRFGLKVTFPSIEAADVLGVIETDFYGDLATSGGAEARPMPRLRHAYFSIGKTFGDNTVGMKMGQTWATATPLIFPSLINPGAGWGMGNTWQRMPLVELYGSRKMGNFFLALQLSAARPMTGATVHTGGSIETSIDAGEASGLPIFQGQLSLKGKAAGFSINLAVGGAYGKEDYSDGVTKGKNIYYGKEVDLYFFNAGLNISHRWGFLKGKFFTGSNADLFGAFGGAIRTTKDDSAEESFSVIGSSDVMGGWGEIGFKPLKSNSVSFGMGIEKPDSDQEGFCGPYDKNSAMWVAAYQTFFERVTFGFNWLRVTTEQSEKEITGDSFVFSGKLVF